MLTQKTVDIVKAVTPVVAENAETITGNFYPRMFDGNPEVLAYFNQAHQFEGAQPQALANAVCAYFANIDNLGALGPAVDLIANKHCSLGVQPEQYPIVGKHLLDAIAEVLGDAVTPEIAAAVTEAYGTLADVCIGREAQLYQEQLDQPGGWTGHRTFTVSSKTQEADGIASFVLTPADGGPLPKHLPGQYVAVNVDVPGQAITPPRNYSISDAPRDASYRITVKREPCLHASGPEGIVSNYLHDEITVGEQIGLAAPYGVFTLDPGAYNGRPAVFIAGGIGITPVLPMAKALVAAHPDAKVRFIHAVRTADVRPFAAELNALAQSGSDVASVHCAVEDGSDPTAAAGRISPELLRVWLPDADFDVYLCGPRAFMSAVHSQLVELGVPDSAINYECFGPLQPV
jgi:nitric oxide dioxygenase